MMLAGRVALVTGAGSGISREIAHAYAEQGATVICADRDGDAAERAAVAIRSAGARAQALRCDVTVEADRDAAVALATSFGGGLDILVNGAGILRAQPLLDVTVESFQSVLDVNVSGLFFMLQAGARAMIAGDRRGRIINLASIAGRQGVGTSVQYAASKAAVISITQSAGQALAAHGIRVNAIAPGFVRTAMWREIQAMAVADTPGVTARDFDDALARQVASGRLADPADIVGTALFLAGDGADYVVGQTINVDGGTIFN
ncbi:SDR family NAD(P)-dependent oxidoreductase [Sphingomonas solaris]|uniref:Glucose 1-dehydrogenase n=1 Tax=Alterirhizorhabdus solaris TaxID=2529389 RepID=A0A558R528_9SPHN|nr:glucose 1-dehydrogenase [Sphingomonas solaris]TVV74469.1 glucose 1-dehydrogenase [Sphingomonas solaris]